MRLSRVVAAVAISFWAIALPSLAHAGQWQYDPASDLVLDGSVPVARWYGERPSMKPPTYRIPDHFVPCPNRMCGYPVPIYKARQPVRVVGPVHARSAAHVEWCAARYRSYDARSDTYQPYHGERRHCRSPYR